MTRPGTLAAIFAICAIVGWLATRATFTNLPLLPVTAVPALAALALAEITARDAGVPQYGTIRRNVNQLLKDALSKP